jgi:hypothetical protein
MGENTSEVSVANQALGWLGLDPIISLDDPSKSAQLCKTNLPPLRDAVLEGVEWTFAQQRATMAPETTIPIWGYAQRFLLPAGCLKVNYVTDSPDIYESMPLDPWVKEGQYILCNATTIYIRYTERITDPKVWSEGFSQALASRLASDIAIPATNSQSHMKLMWDLYGVKLAEATQNDGRQGRRQFIRSNDLKNARQSAWRGQL